MKRAAKNSSDAENFFVGKGKGSETPLQRQEAKNKEL